MISYRAATASDFETIRQLLSELGWSDRVADRGAFLKLMENSSRTVVAIDDGRIVGFVRGLCDDVSNGYISMLGVAATHRRRGIGRELIRRLTGDDAMITWVLRAGRDSGPFWERVGFVSSDIAMERPRRVA